MIVTLTGNNSFAIRRRLNELSAKFAREHGDMALERIDAEEATPRVIIDAVQSIPFLSSRKMVILRDLSANKEATEQIEQIIYATGETTDLVIYDTQIDRRTSYFKVLKSNTQLEQYNELDNHALANWLVEEAKKQKGQISLADANFLVERVGSSQALLANELDKLLTYDSKISRENVELLTEAAPQGRIFELLDAAFGGNKKAALQLYAEQRAQKVEPQAILAMITWQLHLLTAAKLGSGRSPSAIAGDLGIKPYPVSRAAGLAAKLSEESIKELVEGAFEIDLKGKTTNIDLDEALKTYIVTM